MPTFFLGLLLLFFLYYQLTVAGYPIFPPGGYAPLSDGLGPWVQHLILPWFTLALVSAATYTRLTRASMLEVLGEDYVRTARSKGIRESRVITRHALRSAMTPVVTQFGIDVGALVGGVVVTETVFSLPGLGKTVDRRHQPAGSARHHRDRALRLVRGRRGQHHRRHVLCRPRPARPPALIQPSLTCLGVLG